MTQPPGCGIPRCGTAPARLYPAGWRCGPHAPDPGVSVTAVPPGARTRPAPRPGPCRYCGKPAHRADATGTVHECCLAWQHVIASGQPCPACQVAAITARTGRLPDRLPPLPAVLPDGTPYAPDPPPVPRCATCGQAMTVLVPGQRFHPLCQPEASPGALLRPRPCTRRSAATLPLFGEVPA